MDNLMMPFKVGDKVRLKKSFIVKNLGFDWVKKVNRSILTINRINEVCCTCKENNFSYDLIWLENVKVFEKRNLYVTL